MLQCQKELHSLLPCHLSRRRRSAKRSALQHGLCWCRLHLCQSTARNGGAQSQWTTIQRSADYPSRFLSQMTVQKEVQHRLGRCSHLRAHQSTAEAQRTPKRRTLLRIASQEASFLCHATATTQDLRSSHVGMMHQWFDQLYSTTWDDGGSHRH